MHDDGRRRSPAVDDGVGLMELPCPWVIPKTKQLWAGFLSSVCHPPLPRVTESAFPIFIIIITIWSCKTVFLISGQRPCKPYRGKRLLSDRSYHGPTQKCRTSVELFPDPSPCSGRKAGLVVSAQFKLPSSICQGLYTRTVPTFSSCNYL